MTALYCVFGNPVAHSRSPDIHHAFAAQQGDDLRYENAKRRSDFAGAVNALRADGGLGANVTVPFKEQAHQLCDAVTERADLAGAVNTLWWEGDQLNGDNTDGVGLVTDIRENLGWAIQGKRVLVLVLVVRCGCHGAVAGRETDPGAGRQPHPRESRDSGPPVYGQLTGARQWPGKLDGSV